MLAELEAEEFIELVKVDILGLSAEMVAAKIEEAMQETPADFYVVNMSFAIIPCEFVADFESFDEQLRGAARNQSQYRGIFQRAVAFYDQSVFPVNSSHFQEETGLDPLQDFFTANAETVVPIASAGNFGLDYPFWPGAWGQVVSVSGSTGEGFASAEPWDKRDNSPLLGFDTEETGRKGTRISNFGEVMLPGEYASEFGDVVGTSFAAPRMSVIVALYLSAVGGDFCSKENGSIALDHGEWTNLTLEEAAECTVPTCRPICQVKWRFAVFAQPVHGGPAAGRAQTAGHRSSTATHFSLSDTAGVPGTCAKPLNRIDKSGQNFYLGFSNAR
jgi:hypothetical protein